MAKRRVLRGADVCAILTAHGFKQVRQRGSHVVMQRSEIGGTVTVIVPNHSEIARGTLSSIIRQSKLPRDAFES